MAMERTMRKLFAVCTVVLVIVVLWYGAAVKMNAKWAYDQAARAKVELSFSDLVRDTWAQERPVLPAPHQVAAELWDSTVMKKVNSKRSLIFHGWITLEATLLGFVVGTLLGIVLSVGIIYIRAMDMSVMPWAIASQTIPILAIAPMIIVVLNSVGIQGLIPKAIISAYLSFFPVLVGMVKGLRAPDHMQLDLLKTYNASRSDAFYKLRLPSSVPYLFTSMKVGIAASLVGTIVGELPTGAIRGLGARLLTGSYYGQTIQMWAALFAAALLAAGLVALVGLAEKSVLKKMGMVR
nr:ABC transporter permease [uncultured Cohaesibacter sp.]